VLPQYVVTAQEAAVLNIRVYLELAPATAAAAPRDELARAQFTAWAKALVLAVPHVRDVVVGSRPNDPARWAAGAAAYGELLADTYDALKSVDPGIQVIGGSLDGTQDPAGFVSRIGAWYRTSGRAAPLMDAIALQPAYLASSEPPDTLHPSAVSIADYPRFVARLRAAFGGTPQPGRELPILYDGFGVQSAAPAAKAPLYTNPAAPTAADAVPEAAQAAAYAKALQLAFCQPTARALLFQHAVDDADLAGWQSGLYYPDLTAKTSLGSVRATVRAARSGALEVCPGVTPPPAAPVLQLDAAT